MEEPILCRYSKGKRCAEGLVGCFSNCLHSPQRWIEAGSYFTTELYFLFSANSCTFSWI